MLVEHSAAVDRICGNSMPFAGSPAVTSGVKNLDY